MTLYCPQCGNNVDEASRTCPSCGYELAGKYGSKSTIKVVAAVAVICCAICAVVAITAIVSMSKNDTAATDQAVSEPVKAGVQAVAEEAVEVSNTEPPGTTVWSDAYLWPSDKYYISQSDLQGYTQEGVAAIRNEIYARHGYMFKKEKWQNYFAGFSWYTPDPSFSTSMFNEVENANIATIVAYEKSMGWRGDSAPANYSNAAISGYLWPTNTCYITEADLENYSQDEVAAIRNEIYARHGYMFNKEKWQNYFAEFSWYTPNPSFSTSMFNEVENANLSTIINFEKARGWYPD
ncbi:MAG: YARHG domain-containing protein [Bacillota bacterium]|nr:YARHG domain-containing protein [Bacillota bacterium]